MSGRPLNCFLGAVFSAKRSRSLFFFCYDVSSTTCALVFAPLHMQSPRPRRTHQPLSFLRRRRQQGEHLQRFFLGPQPIRPGNPFPRKREAGIRSQIRQESDKEQPDIRRDLEGERATNWKHGMNTYTFQNTTPTMLHGTLDLPAVFLAAPLALGGACVGENLIDAHGRGNTPYVSL